MTKYEFVKRFFPEAEAAEKQFHINPVVMLAQAAIESGWGESDLSKRHRNLFGITGYGPVNDFWHGCGVALVPGGLSFRKYADTQSSFFDYARLIVTAYPAAAAVSYYPSAFAREIAYSKYISEVNGDNRAVYCRLLDSLSVAIGKLLTTPVC